MGIVQRHLIDVQLHGLPEERSEFVPFLRRYKMSKMIIGFLGIFAVVFFAIQGFVAARREEKLQLAKVLGYSLLCSTVATAIAAAIVILF
jgi:hypothetical protein